MIYTKIKTWEQMVKESSWCAVDGLLCCIMADMEKYLLANRTITINKNYRYIPMIDAEFRISPSMIAEKFHDFYSIYGKNILTK